MIHSNDLEHDQGDGLGASRGKKREDVSQQPSISSHHRDLLQVVSQVQVHRLRHARHESSLCRGGKVHGIIEIVGATK